MEKPFLSVLRDGRVVAQGSTTLILPSAGTYSVVVRIPDLRLISWVLRYRFSTNPVCDPGSPVNEKITGNVVGFTLAGVGAATTLTVDVLAVGV